MNIKVVGAVAAAFGIGGAVGYLTRGAIESKKAHNVEECVYNKLKEKNKKIDELKKKICEINEKLEQSLNYESDSKDPVKPEEFVEDLEEIEAPAPEEKENDEMDIYAIGIGDFMQDAEYSKVYLTYYKRDGKLADQSDRDITADAEMILGDLVELFAEYTGSVMYIRNESNLKDYEIDFENDAFADYGPGGE